ncbi:MAG: four helix bundle protein [Phycisphaeraceae bacterium]
MSIQMTRFNHEKLDVYKVALEFVGWSGLLIDTMNNTERNTCDHLDLAAVSILLNIAEGNGKRATRDRQRFFEIARGSAMECAACLDVFTTRKRKAMEEVERGKELLVRVVSMLVKMAPPTEGLRG